MKKIFVKKDVPQVITDFDITCPQCRETSYS